MPIDSLIEHQAMAAELTACRHSLASAMSAHSQLQATHEETLDRMQRLTRFYSGLTRCSQAIVHSRSEAELFEQICRIAVKSAGLVMAWIGLIDPASQMVRPVKVCADASGYLGAIQISIEASTPYGRGPTGTAIRERRPMWCQTFDDITMDPWREGLKRAGCHSLAALPLYRHGVAIGALGLYAGTPHFFGQEARALLEEIAADVSYALDNLTRVAQQKEAERLLRDNDFAARLAVDNTRSALKQLEQQKYALDQHAIVAIVDVKGLITYANDKFCEVSGYSRQQLLGQDHVLLNSGIHAHGFFKAMYETVAHGKVWHGEVCNRAQDGHLYWVDTTIAPFMGNRGKPEQYIAIRTDITQRKANELELQGHRDHLEERVRQQTTDLRQNERKLTEILESVDACIYLKDTEGRYLFANRPLCELFGAPMADIVSHSDEKFMSAAAARQVGVNDQRILRDGETLRTEETIVSTITGLTSIYLSVKLPLRNEAGQIYALCGISTNITDRKHNENAAHAANRAKSEFLANMSHEIRTPMNGVVGMVDILQQTELKPEQRRMLGTIYSSSLALLQVLNDILDFSKIEAGKLAIESVPTHLREVTESVAQLTLAGSSAKSVELSLLVSPELPRWILSDPTRLRQVLLNLLGNAVKFRPREGLRVARVTLWVEPVVLADGRAGMQMRVIDNGIGMGPGVVAKLFQPFTQADESTARKFGGTGLGLSISDRLVQLMGGRIAVRSTLGEGSEFIVELPLEASAPARMEIFDPSLAGVQVLGVTQDEAALKIIPAYCRAAGAQVTMVPDLQAARQQLQQAPMGRVPTVVLLGLRVTTPGSELNLPADVGVVRLVRQGQTAVTDEITVNARPLLYIELLQTLAVAANRLIARDMPDPPAHQHAPVRPVAPSVEEAARSGRLILLAEDNETNSDVLLEQLRLLGYAAEVARDGALGLQMWRAGHYAMLLTDCHMPNMDGFELTQAIRQAEAPGTRLPIIAITANAMQGEAERCRERGMDDYLAKPLRLTELGPVLARWLPLPHGPAQGGAAVAEAVPATATAPATVAARSAALAAWDANTLPQLVGDNPAMHRRLLQRFLLNAKNQVAAIGDALAASETGRLAGVAHTLKSAARSVGALALGELCQALETAGRAGDGPGCGRLAAGLAEASERAAIEIQAHMASQPNESRESK